MDDADVDARVRARARRRPRSGARDTEDERWCCGEEGARRYVAFMLHDEINTALWRRVYTRATRRQRSSTVVNSYRSNARVAAAPPSAGGRTRRLSSGRSGSLSDGTLRF